MQAGDTVIPTRDRFLDTNYILHRQQQQQQERLVPLAADVTTANVPDNEMYVLVTSSSSSVFSLPSALYIIADPGYNDKNLYEYSKKTLGIDLVCPVKRYKSNPKERLEIVCFYHCIGVCNLQPEKDIGSAAD